MSSWSITQRAMRVKTFKPGESMMTELKRCLRTVDVVLFGLGCMVGSGMYVVTGQIAHSVCGPAIPLAFLVAGLASALSASCYAEFAAHTPRAGSAYLYAYVTLGELPAFIIGWNMILEEMLSDALLVRGAVGYIDILAKGALYNFSEKILGTAQIDPYAPVIVIIFGFIVCSGVKESVKVGNILTLVNITVAIFLIISGFILGDKRNLTQYGGFLPKGPSSIFQGAARAYFSYIGYDYIAMTSEEVFNPRFAIPFALGFDVAVVCVLYCIVSAALTYMVPWTQIDENAPFASAFEYNNLIWAEYIIGLGAISAMACSFLNGLISIPRCAYAMAQDGVIFDIFAKVSSSTQVPVFAVFVISIIIAISSMCFTVNDLINLLSIGTLLSYTIIAFAVIILRYTPREGAHPGELSESEPLLKSRRHWSRSSYKPLSLFLASVIALNIVLNLYDYINDIAFYILIAVTAILSILSLVWVKIISKEQHFNTTCQVPGVPWVPGVSVFVNMYLMTQLSPWAWVRLVCWVIIGFFVYFLYGIKHSKLEVGASREKDDSRDERYVSGESDHNYRAI